MMAVTVVVRLVMPAVRAAARGWYEGEVGAGGEVQRGPRVRPHLAVHQQPVAGLEGLDRVQRDRPEVAVGGDAERPLQHGHGRPAVVQADDDLTSNRRSPARRGQRGPRVGADLAVDQQPV